MPRPCVCDAPDCRSCTLWRTDSNFRALWEQAPPAASAPAPQIVAPHPVLARALECVHKGAATGRLVGCGACGGKAAGRVLEVRACAVHGSCTDTASVEKGLAQCQGCPDLRKPAALAPMPSKLRWAYGVTTVPGRRGDLLPRTLASLRGAGFNAPRLFVDGAKDVLSWEREFALEVTVRDPNIRTYGNWVLALAELFIRSPACDRYAVFQDDFVTYRNLRPYLERCHYPERGYWNLYTFPSNQELCPTDQTVRKEPLTGWYESNQLGRGAVALVFSREAVTTLLTHQHMVERPMDVNRGWKAVDGTVVTAMTKAGWTEWVHNPSLVQHTGAISSMGNKPHKLSESFRGEEFDALELLR